MNMFEGFGSDQSVRYYVCKTGGLQLYLAIMPMRIGEDGYPTNKTTKEEDKQLLRDFPYEVSDCRCRNCRYLRMWRRNIFRRLFGSWRPG